MFGQHWGDSTLKEKVVFTSVEEPPKFPGGIKKFYQFIAENLKLPSDQFAQFSNKIVLVKIIIDKSGSAAYAEIEKGINEEYNQTAIDLIPKMPTWSPGKQNGKPVLCYQTIPIYFVGG